MSSWLLLSHDKIFQIFRENSSCTNYDTIWYESLTWTEKLSMVSLISYTRDQKQKYVKRSN